MKGVHASAEALAVRTAGNFRLVKSMGVKRVSHYLPRLYHSVRCAAEQLQAPKMKGVLCDKGNLTYSLDVPLPKLADGQVLISVKATGGFQGSPQHVSGLIHCQCQELLVNASLPGVSTLSPLQL